MKTKKIEELTKRELNYWSAVATGQRLSKDWDQDGLIMIVGAGGDRRIAWEPTVNWCQGGPLIEEYLIDLESKSGYWLARHFSHSGLETACYSPLCAAMSVLVRLRMGFEVPEMPKRNACTR